MGEQVKRRKPSRPKGAVRDDTLAACRELIAQGLYPGRVRIQEWIKRERGVYADEECVTRYRDELKAEGLIAFGDLPPHKPRKDRKQSGPASVER